MARGPVLAAGGVVLRHGTTTLVAVVRQRKRDEWVLPKGKLASGETAREAAVREVLEETGHAVSVHEFLGTLAYQSGGGPKFVHFWRMQADGEPVGQLMKDVKDVAWLSLDDAIARLSREYERAFLAQVGPIALEARKRRPKAGPSIGHEAEPQPEPVDARQEAEPDQVEPVMPTLSPVETASVAQLGLGLLQRFKAWVRGEA